MKNQYKTTKRHRWVVGENPLHKTNPMSMQYWIAVKPSGSKLYQCVAEFNQEESALQYWATINPL
jgi:hypothetical protein